MMSCTPSPTSVLPPRDPPAGRAGNVYAAKERGIAVPVNEGGTPETTYYGPSSGNAVCSMGD